MAIFRNFYKRQLDFAQPYWRPGIYYFHIPSRFAIRRPFHLLGGQRPFTLIILDSSPQLANISFHFPLRFLGIRPHRLSIASLIL